jgi:hypothetical protein
VRWPEARQRCAGHAGAQLAVLAEGAVGAAISAWWPLDEAWYQVGRPPRYPTVVAAGVR